MRLLQLFHFFPPPIRGLGKLQRTRSSDINPGFACSCYGCCNVFTELAGPTHVEAYFPFRPNDTPCNECLGWGGSYWLDTFFSFWPRTNLKDQISIPDNFSLRFQSHGIQNTPHTHPPKNVCSLSIMTFLLQGKHFRLFVSAMQQHPSWEENGPNTPDTPWFCTHQKWSRPSHILHLHFPV